jgi:hypothetical protein
MYTRTLMYPMYMKKFKKIIRHTKFISMNRRLLWMHLEGH